MPQYEVTYVSKDQKANPELKHILVVRAKTEADVPGVVEENNILGIDFDQVKVDSIQELD